jgi:ketosteroid isomerase-like protein
VRASWQAQAAMRLGGELRPAEMRVILGQDLAATHGYVSGHNLNAQGKRRAVSIRETNLFRKENGAWKMVGNHSDRLPFLEPPAP